MKSLGFRAVKFDAVDQRSNDRAATAKEMAGLARDGIATSISGGGHPSGSGPDFARNRNRGPIRLLRALW